MAETRTLRIGLIEDSEHDRIAFRRSLRQASVACEIVEYERAEGLIADLDRNTLPALDVVVVDYDLPGINGLTLFKSLNYRKTNNLPPFVMLTGAGTETVAAEALKAGMYDYVVKDTRHGYLELLPVVLDSAIRRYCENQERIQARKALQEANDFLEQRVAERTAELTRAIEALESEVTERKRMEQQLRSSERRLRMLSHRVLEVQENDRQTVAKELHDSIGASLAAIKFSLESRIEQMQDRKPEGVISLELITEHLRQAIEESRRIAAFLRPPMLEDLGLVSCLKSFCHQMNRHYGKVRIVPEVDINEHGLEDRLKVVVYRIIQEAINNALKHSGADTIRVRMAERESCLELDVTDNGRGFDAGIAGSSPMSSYGLQSMRERAAVCDGVCRITSSPGQGTTVSVRFPLATSGPTTTRETGG